MWMDPNQGESQVESGAGTLDFSDSEDQNFLMNHMRSGTRKTYGLGWCWLHSFFKEYKVNTELAPLVFNNEIHKPYVQL